jgi:hypothetical protein
MEAREVETPDTIKWQCVQAFEGVNGNLAARANEVLGEPDKVVVVCTPSGGAQSVRIKLPNDWKEKTTDDELIRAIEKQRR